MLESTRSELDAAYCAVEALLSLTDGQTFPFRIGVIDEARWAIRGDVSDRNPVAQALGCDRFELACCSPDIARAVLIRVVEIAKTPIFNDRCRNRTADAPEIPSSVSQLVIYLMRYTEIATDVGPEEPTMPGVPRAMSGVRPRVRSAKSA